MRERERERGHISFIILYQEELSNAKISGSVDNPEGMLDALLQVALCEVRQDTYFSSYLYSLTRKK